MTTRGSWDDDEFGRFVEEVESRLRRALVATYGPSTGRQAAVDALSWAWEHWDRLRTMTNPVGYLYRVGQSASRRYGTHQIPLDGLNDDAQLPDIHPELIRALRRLSAQQRTIVLLVHGFGWTLRDVASTLEIAPSTVREHLGRAVARLQTDLEVNDA